MKCPCCGKEITPIIWELKSTSQSNNKAIEENVSWIRQILTQAYVLGSTKVVLTRLEIMGDWKWVYKPRGFKDWSEEDRVEFLEEHPNPTLSAWGIEFTQEELDELWSWMLDRRELWMQVMETGKLLPKVAALASGNSWECGFCSYKEECASG